ncbi:Assimilatory nitrate reductase catalytic subunit [compost metagenome]
MVSQYLSGTQTRRIGKLVDQFPEPFVEIHPNLAAKYGIKQRELVKVSTRRGEGIFPANIVETIRQDTVFVPYHWPGLKSANQLTIATLDPVSKMPEFKVCACQLEPLGTMAPPSNESDAYASV